MPLPDRVQGALRPSLQLTWIQEDGTPEDLTGATLGAVLFNEGTGVARAASGVFVVVDGAAGVFRWDLAAADVATAGYYSVMFTAAFPGAPTPAKSFETAWTVRAMLVPA